MKFSGLADQHEIGSFQKPGRRLKRAAVNQDDVAAPYRYFLQALPDADGRRFVAEGDIRNGIQPEYDRRGHAEEKDGGLHRRRPAAAAYQCDSPRQQGQQRQVREKIPFAVELGQGGNEPPDDQADGCDHGKGGQQQAEAFEGDVENFPGGAGAQPEGFERTGCDQGGQRRETGQNIGAELAA